MSGRRSIAPRDGVLLIDGPMGTELGARGVALPAPGWSAAALDEAPEVVAAIHRDYAAAGALVHTANTFRTKRRTYPDRWRDLTARAVAIARQSVPTGQAVAGSVAPLEDCYSPWLSPPDPGPEHAELAEALVDAGVDLLLCETFPHVGEGLAALDAAVATGVETWVAFTAGPSADLLSPAEIAAAGREAARRGASAVLVNCIPANIVLSYVEQLSDLPIPIGCYANAGRAEDGLGWERARPDAPARYADLAEAWVRAGATIIGGCCGTTPRHVSALRARFPRPDTPS